MQLKPVHVISNAILYPSGSTDCYSPSSARFTKRLRMLSSSSPLFVCSRLTEVGLPSSGSNEEITGRYREFLLKWNTNADTYCLYNEQRIVRIFTATEFSVISRKPTPTPRDFAFIEAFDEDEMALGPTPSKKNWCNSVWIFNMSFGQWNCRLSTWYIEIGTWNWWRHRIINWRFSFNESYKCSVLLHA